MFSSTHRRLSSVNCDIEHIFSSLSLIFENFEVLKGFTHTNFHFHPPKPIQFLFLLRRRSIVSTFSFNLFFFQFDPLQSAVRHTNECSEFQLSRYTIPIYVYLFYAHRCFWLFRIIIVLSRFTYNFQFICVDIANYGTF